MIGSPRGLRLLWGACLITVIVGSLLPGDSAPMVAIDSLGVSDKLQHCGAYAVLAFLPCIYERRRVAVMLLVLAAAMGVLLEFGQLFSPGRSFDVYDMLADGIGIILGAAAALPVRLRHDRHRPSVPNPAAKSLVESGK
jgi:VanZ family protein